MYDIITAISKMDIFAEQAHQKVSKHITDRVDEILIVMEEMGYPGERALEIATRHVLSRQHEYNGKNKALNAVNRIIAELQSDDEFAN